jgi:hypothetical protein
MPRKLIQISVLAWHDGSHTDEQLLTKVRNVFKRAPTLEDAFGLASVAGSTLPDDVHYVGTYETNIFDPVTPREAAEDAHAQMVDPAALPPIIQLVDREGNRHLVDLGEDAESVT